MSQLIMIDSKNLQCMSWNVSGIMSSCTYLSDTLRALGVDFCGISEHWLFENCLSFINSIDSDYKSVSTADKDCKVRNGRKVGKGGVALLWHVKHDKYVTQLNILI